MLKIILKEMQNMIYTIGTSDRSKSEFVSMLQQHGIKVIYDIRSKTGSRTLHFDEVRFKNFSKMTEEVGVEYKQNFHISLGGLQNGKMTIGNYRRYAETDEFQEALSRLEKEIDDADGNVALVCCERNWKTCHRMIVAERLRRKGWDITHL
jgi:uncharacterized protein (DUF488 family)